MIWHMAGLAKTKTLPIYLSRCKRSGLISSMTTRWEHVTCKLCLRRQPQHGVDK